jgi:hypothetical protein
LIIFGNVLVHVHEYSEVCSYEHSELLIFRSFGSVTLWVGSENLHNFYAYFLLSCFPMVDLQIIKYKTQCDFCHITSSTFFCSLWCKFFHHDSWAMNLHGDYCCFNSWYIHSFIYWVDIMHLMMWIASSLSTYVIHVLLTKTQGQPSVDHCS